MENTLSYIPEILILLFIAIVFLQSGFDKILDWKGNIAWLKSHFEKTFLGGMVPLMVGIVMIVEVLAGFLALAGIFTLIVMNDQTLALYAMVLAAATLLMLLFGQRIAKDYPGAFTITGYFMVVVFGIYLLTV
ncbi:MAG TPA: DoxX family protein [Salinimicrobium sp.]|nr:DoxX family protein [Salinimicrobium sp.]